MKYTKKLLARDSRPVEDAKFYGNLFEILNNEKMLEEFVETLLTQLEKIDGDIHIVQRNGETFDVLTDTENENKEDILNSLVFKNIRDTKKPYFHSECEKEERGFYAGFPLNLKGRFIGGLIIENKQEIKHWKEIHTVLHMLVFVFRFYKLVEKERNISIKDITTGLYNEKYFYNHFEIEEEKYRRFKTPMTLVLFRVKNIAEINDKYGYEVGEKILRSVGRTIKSQSRLIDMPAKIDKGLFAVLLSSTSEIGGEALSTRVNMIVDESIEVSGKKVSLEFEYAYAEFENHNSKESFLEQILADLKKSEKNL